MVTCATKSLSSVLFTPVTLNPTHAQDQEADGYSDFESLSFCPCMAKAMHKLPKILEEKSAIQGLCELLNGESEQYVINP